MDDDRLVAFRDALLAPRAVPVPGTDQFQFTVTAGMRAGVEDLDRRAPGWGDNDDARAVYTLAFEAGWLEAHRRLKIVLGFPEARGRGVEASLLAMDPALAFDEIAVRLRAAAVIPVVAGNDPSRNVVPFRRPAT